MAAAAHSQFPASATKRLLICPGSYGASLAVAGGDRRASVYSAEGTLAHLLAETKLRTGLPWDRFVNRPYTVDGFSYTPDQTYIDYVRTYTDYVELLREIGYEIKLEVSVSPTHLFDLPPPIDLYGTADCLAYDPSERALSVIDLKFGKGEPVSPAENPQLLYYAAGALKEFPEAETVTLTIIQPRVGGEAIRMWPTSAKAVETWTRNVLAPGVDRAIADMGETLVPGDHCGFCPVFQICDAPKRAMIALGENFTGDTEADPNMVDPLALPPVATMPPDKIAEILFLAEIVQPLIDLAKDRAKELLKAGTDVPGWELHSRAKPQTWAAEESAVLSAIAMAGGKPEDALSIKTPSQVKTAIGKQVFDRLPDELLSPPDRVPLLRPTQPTHHVITNATSGE